MLCIVDIAVVCGCGWVVDREIQCKCDWGSLLVGIHRNGWEFRD